MLNRKERRAAQKTRHPVAGSDEDAAWHFFSVAVQYHQAGQVGEAEKLCRQALGVFPRHADSWHLLGGMALQRGDAAEAETLIGKAAGLAAGNALYMYNLGVARAQGGRLGEAAEAYGAAIGCRPDYVEAHYNLGNVLAGLGDFAGAAESYRRVLGFDAWHVDAVSNLGAALARLEQEQEAAACYRRAILLNPRIANVHYNLGKLLHEQGRIEEAVGCYEAALRCRPEFVEALSNLGNGFTALQRAGEALAFFDRALALRADYAEAYVNRAEALRVLHRHGEALAACEAALALQPGLALAHEKRGYTLYELGRAAEARAALEEAIRLAPARAVAHTGLIISMHYEAGADEAEILQAAGRFEKALDVTPKMLFGNARDPARKLRIGYVSGDFKQHVAGFFLEPVFSRHDRGRFEIHGYYNDFREDWMTARLRAHCDNWRNIAGLSDAAVAALVEQDGIDILVDLSGHTGLNRLPVFARKAAPVQVSWLGFWGTTGLSAMDYVLSDGVTIPLGDEGFYREEVVRLPQRLCYAPPSYALPPAPAPHLANGFVTFGSFNNLLKIGPEVFRVWAQVLRAVPEAKLLLKWASLGEPAVRQGVLAGFAGEGVGAERLKLRGASPHPDMLAEYDEVDVALDPFPFSGGMTSCEALWMGVPVVTWPGRRAVSRQTLGFLQAIGREEFIAESAEDYVRRAAALAGDSARLVELRQALRPQMQASPLCDASGFTRHLEAAYRTMWRRWV